MVVQNFSSKFISQLNHLKLPGWEAQQIMSPKPDLDRQKFELNNYRKAAALILLYLEDNKLFLPAIKRTQDGGVHGGQISLPGGQIESTDASSMITAMRETEEEIGIPRKDVVIIRALTDVYIPPSNFLVTPFVGFVPEKPTWKPSQREVDYVVEISFADLLDERNVQYTRKKMHHVEYTIPYYFINNEKIWGATAMILSEFIAIMRHLEH